MRIQWILIAALLMVSLFSEAQTPTNLLEGTPYVQPSEGFDATQMMPVLPVSALAITPAGVPAAAKTANDAIEKCNASSLSAGKICIASKSPILQTGIIAVTGLMSAIDLASNTSDSCKKFGSALDLAKTAMTAYTAACGVAQMNCNSACMPVSKALKAATALGIETKNQLASYTLMIKQCNGYQLSLAAASAGVLSIVTQSVLAGKCEKATTVDCVVDPMNAACTKALDCSVAANASNTTCICLKAPNTAGCAGYTGGNANQVNQSAAATEASLDEGNFSIPSPNFGVDAVAPPTSSGGNGVAPTGGGGGAGGLSGGGSDASKGNAKGQGKALNANILSGFDGGGGGGGGGYRGSSSGSSSDSGLQAYLPKGSKDPARNPAMQLFGNGQVTGAGSKSNFEKVSERYNDAKGSLITAP